MQRWVQQADGHWQAVHGPEDALKVLGLVALQLLESLLSSRRLQLHGSNHAAHSGNALVGGKEHVLCAGQADALGAVGDGNLCVERQGKTRCREGWGKQTSKSVGWIGN